MFYRKRSAVTLTEILIVLALLAIITAVTIPSIKLIVDGMKEDAGSERFRHFLRGARSRAAEKQRPVGVWIERKGGEAFNVAIAETPPNYSGDLIDSGCVTDGSGGFGTTGTAVFDPARNSLLPVLCKTGDRIKFNHRGIWYDVLSVTSTQVRFTSEYPANPVKTPAGLTVPYTIERTPERRTAVVTLPQPATVDLTVSGTGFDTTAFNGSGPIIVMFSPSGNVDAAYWNGAKQQPTNGIHFLIGRSDNVNATNPGDPAANLNNGSTKWVSISTTTGRISSSPNQPWSAVLNPSDPLSAKISHARQNINR